MRSVGVDVAVAGYSAVALVVDGVPTRSAVWKPDNKHDSDAVRLEKFYIWLRRWLKMLNPDVIAVEELAVFMNKNDDPGDGSARGRSAACGQADRGCRRSTLASRHRVG